MTHHQQSWAEAPDISRLCGRQRELEELEQRIRLDGCRFLVVCGVAGIGKSLLVSQLAHCVRDLFSSRVWQSMAAQPPLSPEDCATALMQRLENSPRSTHGITHLLDHLFQHECLIVLDGFEALLRPQAYNGSYLPGYDAYRDLLDRLSQAAHRSCVIITTRELPAHIHQNPSDQHSVVCTLSGLKALEGKELLERRQLWTHDASTWPGLVEKCEGNPFILNEAAEFGLSFFDGNATSLMNDIQLTELGEVQRIHREQLERLSAPETWVLQSLFYTRSARLNDLRARRKQLAASPGTELNMSGMNLLEILAALMRRSLIVRHITPTESRYTIAPLLHQYLQERNTQGGRL